MQPSYLLCHPAGTGFPELFSQAAMRLGGEQAEEIGRSLCCCLECHQGHTIALPQGTRVQGLVDHQSLVARTEECPEKTPRGPSVSPTLSGPTIVSSASTTLAAKVSNDLLGAPQWGLSAGMAFHPLQETLGSEKQRPTQKHDPRVLHCPLLGLQFHTSEVPGERKVSPMRAQINILSIQRVSSDVAGHSSLSILDLLQGVGQQGFFFSFASTGILKTNLPLISLC